MKSHGHRLERLTKRTGLVVHAEAYSEHLTNYKNALSAARSSYYANVIHISNGNSKVLFSTVNKLLQPPDNFPLCISTDLCNKFLSFFHTKVDAIHQQLLLTSTEHDVFSPTLELVQTGSLTQFLPVNDSTLSEVISKCRSTTCQLDPMPTSLVKSCLRALLPLLLAIINSSLTSGTVPSSLKVAAVTPIRKKTGADPENLHNFRPISNLPFLAKTLERIVAIQLQDHLSTNQLLEPFQSGFRTKHSTETALVKVINDLLHAADNNLLNILVLLDLSAAFDTVCHKILLERLANLGITHLALSWLNSYLSDRQQYISIKNHRSDFASVTKGVPQGSVLGPLLFIIYLQPLGQIMRRHGVSFHCYADDTQLYISSKPSSALPPPSLINCLQDIRIWMTRNFLKLNGDKSEVMLIGSKSTLSKTPNFSITIDGFPIPLSTHVKSLGVILDSTLSFEPHVKHITRSAFFHLRNISKLRPTLSYSTTETLIHAFVTSRLDYCNSILTGIPIRSIRKLQLVQNAAARILTHTKTYDHISPILYKLHWLPVKF